MSTTENANLNPQEQVTTQTQDAAPHPAPATEPAHKADAVVAAVEAAQPSPQDQANTDLKGKLDMSEEAISRLPEEERNQLLELAQNADAETAASPAPAAAPAAAPVADPAAAPQGDGGAPADGDDDDGHVEVETNGKKVKMVPLARLKQETKKVHDLRGKLSSTEEERAYHAGRADGATTVAKPGNDQQPQVDPLADNAAKINGLRKAYDDKVVELAAKYEKGDFTADEWKKQERALERNKDRLEAPLIQERRQIIDEMNAPSPQDLQRQIASNPQLAELTDNLIAENPWVEEMPQAQFKMLEREALISLENQGVRVTPDANGTWTVRQAIIEIGKQCGFDTKFAPKGQPAPAAAPAPKGGAAPASQPQVTVQQRKDKLALADKQPPFVANGVGTGAGGSPTSPASVEAATDMDLSKTFTKAQLEQMAVNGY